MSKKVKQEFTFQKKNNTAAGSSRKEAENEWGQCTERDAYGE